MRKISLFLAYFLKLVGLGVAGFFLLVLFLAHDETTGKYNWNKDLWNIIFIISISVVISLIGSMWSKKLLKK